MAEPMRTLQVSISVISPTGPAADAQQKKIDMPLYWYAQKASDEQILKIEREIHDILRASGFGNFMQLSERDARLMEELRTTELETHREDESGLVTADDKT